jgi:hypothetical protein
MNWRVARTGKAHAFFGTGGPACCGRVRFIDTRTPAVAEVLDVCLVCMKKIDFCIRMTTGVRPARDVLSVMKN